MLATRSCIKTNHKLVSLHSGSTLVLDQATRTWTHLIHNGPDSGEATTFLHILFSTFAHGTYIRMTFCPGTPKEESQNCPGLDFPGFLELTTPISNLRLGWGLQSYNYPQELYNGVLHSTCTHRDRVDSWLLVVGSQIASLIPDPSFNHNLWCICRNAHARPFWTSTLQDLSNSIKNTSMRGVLTPAIKFWLFGSPEGLQVPTFGSVSFILTLASKWGCDTWDVWNVCKLSNSNVCTQLFNWF